MAKLPLLDAWRSHPSPPIIANPPARRHGGDVRRVRECANIEVAQPHHNIINFEHRCKIVHNQQWIIRENWHRGNSPQTSIVDMVDYVFPRLNFPDFRYVLSYLFIFLIYFIFQRNLIDICRDIFKIFKNLRQCAEKSRKFLRYSGGWRFFGKLNAQRKCTLPLSELSCIQL